MSHKLEPVGGRFVTPFTLFLAALVAVAGYFLFIRFTQGLGAVTNLNDGYPWGIWIAYDVVVGTGFACGGYAMALLVYVFNRGEFHPLVRPALTASLFGYSLGGMSVLFDLGRWWNFWHIFWPGYAQPNSVMFEVAACIAAYCVVLWIEFSPAMAERFRLNGLRRFLERAMFFFIGLGVLLPSMHQSSLGTMMVVFGHQVHPLWQTVLLPLLFLVTALLFGLCIVVFEASLVPAAFRRPRETRILAGLIRLIVVVLMVFLALRWGDLILRDQISLAFTGDFHSRMFMIETALFVLPAMILSSASARRSARLLFLAATSMLVGGALYRIDVYLVAYNPGDQWHYFPAAPELLITIGVVALEVLAYNVFVKFFPVLHGAQAADDHPSSQPAPVLVAQSGGR